MVRAPWDVSANDILKFLDKRKAWIEKSVNANAIRLAMNDDIIEYRSVYFDGRKVPLILSAPENKIAPEGIYVNKVEDLESLYKEVFSAEFLRTVNEIAEQSKLFPTSVSIKSYKSRWGCCDAQNNIFFNYAVFMLPQNIRRYVIVHELCHILCHNHSTAFWNLVSEFEPKYKILKKLLAEYDYLVKLY